MKIVIDQKDYNVILANNYFKKLLGLMFRKNINYGMLFPKVNAIHTFFMKENIDVIALDENNKVILKKENMSKRQTLFVNYPIKKTSILELPKNTSHNILVGDILTFISK